jgi:hypothetical protein
MKKVLIHIISILIAVTFLQPEAVAQCIKPVIIADAATVCPGGQVTVHQ